MSAYKETKLHGSLSFPYTVYRVELPDFFNSFPLHWHDELEIIFVSEGIINVMLESEEFSVRQGEIVLIHPQTIHAIKQHGDNRAVYFNILFRFSLLEGNRDDVSVLTVSLLLPNDLDGIVERIASWTPSAIPPRYS